MIALLHDVFRLFGATMLELGDVEQSFDARDDLDERTERRRALHDALVDLPHLGLLQDARYHVARPLGGFADTGDRDQPRIIHVALGARLLLDAPHRLALGPDVVADVGGTS